MADDSGKPVANEIIHKADMDGFVTKVDWLNDTVGNTTIRRYYYETASGDIYPFVSSIRSLSDGEASFLVEKQAVTNELAKFKAYVVDQGSDLDYIPRPGMGVSISHERWWRKWSDGRIEQGGYVGRENISGGIIPNLTEVPMKLSFQSQSTYYVTCNISYNATGEAGDAVPLGSHTVCPLYLYPTYFKVFMMYGADGRSSSVNRPFVWTATGY